MNNPIVVPMTLCEPEPFNMTVQDGETLGFNVFDSVVIAPVKGVKGSAESAYRTGNVSISPADLGMDPSSYATHSEIPTRTSELTNDSGYITNASIPTRTSQLTNDSGFINGSAVPSNETDPTVPSWAKQSTKPSYTASEVGALPDTTVIPSATSQLVNDSGFIVGADVPSNETVPTVPA